MTLDLEAATGRKTDEQLARQSMAGCSHAFTELVDRYEGRLLRFVRRWATSEHDAEDITQDAFVEAWRCLHRYDDRWRFSTWLYTIASRRAASHFRRRKVATSALVETHEDQDSLAPGHAMELDEQRSQMWQLAERLLNDDQRTALLLRYAEGMSAIEIGRVLGKRPVAVRVMLFRARERLAEREGDSGRSAPLPVATPSAESSPDNGSAQAIETPESARPEGWSIRANDRSAKRLIGRTI